MKLRSLTLGVLCAALLLAGGCKTGSTTTTNSAANAVLVTIQTTLGKVQTEVNSLATAASALDPTKASKIQKDATLANTAITDLNGAISAYIAGTGSQATNAQKIAALSAAVSGLLTDAQSFGLLSGSAVNKDQLILFGVTTLAGLVSSL